MIITFWSVLADDWRSRWIRACSDGPAHHVTCTTEGYTLHTDRKRCGWYNTHKLYTMYRGFYEPCARVRVLRRCSMTPVLQPNHGTWEVLKWKYLGGKTPQACTQSVIDCLNHNELYLGGEYVDPNHLLARLDDCNWTKRESADWQVPPDS